MKLILEIAGDAETITRGLDMFVRQHGWGDGHADTKLKFAQDILRQFIRENIAAYAVSSAMSQASTSAQNQIHSMLDQATSILKEG